MLQQSITLKKETRPSLGSNSAWRVPCIKHEDEALHFWKFCLGSKKNCSNCKRHLEMVAFPLRMSMFNRCCKLPRHSKVEGPLAPPVLWGWYFPSFFHLRCVFSKDSWPTMGDELSAEQWKTKNKQFLGAPNSDFDKDTEMLSYSHGDPHT